MLVKLPGGRSSGSPKCENASARLFCNSEEFPVSLLSTSDMAALNSSALSVGTPVGAPVVVGTPVAIVGTPVGFMGTREGILVGALDGLEVELMSSSHRLQENLHIVLIHFCCSISNFLLSQPSRADTSAHCSSLSTQPASNR